MENAKTEFIEYINSLVKDIILKGQEYDTHKEWIKKYCTLAEIDYNTIEDNFIDFHELLIEYKNSGSNTIEKFLRRSATNLYLKDNVIDEIINKFKLEGVNNEITTNNIISKKENNIIWENDRFGTFIDKRDNEIYKVVKIGNQVWMAEDLRYKTSNCKSYANNMPENGCFYYLEEAINICPNGWRLPSKYEIEVLVNYLGGEEIAGGKLKSIDKWEKDPEEDITYEFDYSKNYGNNESGFNAYPKLNSPVYIDDSIDGLSGTFWTETLERDEDAWCYFFDSMSEEISYDFRYKDIDGEFYRVRCILD